MKPSLLTVALLLLPTTFLAEAHEPHPPLPLLTVTGTAESSAAPDRATLRLGTTAQAPTAAEAQAKVSAAVQKTIDSLKQLGIPPEDLSTSNLNLHPVYSQPNQRQMRDNEPFTPQITAYQASNTIEIRLGDLKKVGPAIDASVAAGANQVESLTFDLKDDTAPRSRALESAVKQARAKAETLAKAANVSLGQLHALDEATSAQPPIPYRGMAMRAMAAESATPIEPGQVRVSATVTLRYLFAPTAAPAAEPAK
jgi:uncharacterized protein YggE